MCREAMATMRGLERESVEIIQRCPRFDRCSIPICPLDLLQDQRTRFKGEPKCTLGKPRRSRIGKGTALKYQGLTRKEWAARKRWERLSELQKRRKKALLSKVSPFITGSQAKRIQVVSEDASGNGAVKTKDCGAEFSAPRTVTGADAQVSETRTHYNSAKLSPELK